jgi:L-malate glycosyltransferase
MIKKRILIIENSIDVTGALKSITNSVRAIEMDFDCHFLIPQHSKARLWMESKGLKIIGEIPMQELSRRLGSILLYLPHLLFNAFTLNRVIKANSISLIHVNDIYNLLPIMVRLVGNKTPYICQVRFLPDKFPKWLFSLWLKLHLRYAVKIIAVSKSVLYQLPSHPKITMIYDRPPLKEHHPNKSAISDEKNHFVFLYLSNFIQGKGQGYALEAFSRIHENLSTWRLRFVGSDMGLERNMECKARLMEKAKELNIYEKTDWVGFTDDVELEYKQADIVLNFSESESFSMNCVEALFFGRPVIASNSGGPAEILNIDVGILVPNRDVDAMANAMDKLANSENLRYKMGEQAKVRVKQAFGADKTSDLLRDLYRVVLDSHK